MQARLLAAHVEFVKKGLKPHEGGMVGRADRQVAAHLLEPRARGFSMLRRGLQDMQRIFDGAFDDMVDLVQCGSR